MAFDAAAAETFISDATLPSDRPHDMGVRSITPKLVGDTPQGVVVGSELTTFDASVTADQRAAVANSMLFAQLVANAKVPNREDVSGWLEAYFDVLPQVGWTLAESVRNETEESAVGSELHDKIIPVLAVLLGPAATALAIVTTALTSLQQMNAGSPWITIFNRRSKSATSAGVQVTAASRTADGISVKGAAFRILARRTITQILFFKFTDDESKLFQRAIEMSVDQETLARLAPKITAKVGAMQDDFIAAMPLSAD
jgi:hypothetical protein